MALAPEDREKLFEAVYNVVMGYNRFLIDREEAKTMIEMIARGAAGARHNHPELRPPGPARHGSGSDQSA